jgi:ribosomal protein S18 acetylase RimI-like enzyme
MSKPVLDSKSVWIRAALGTDLPEIMALERTCFENDAWSEATMQGELHSEHTSYFVAMLKLEPNRDILIGYAGLSKVSGSEQADVQTLSLIHI